MRMSTKGRYGLRTMIDIAVNSKGKPVTLNSVAQRQQISVDYLESVVTILKNANILISIKGAQGGYMLACNPSEISIGKILRALEGEMSVVDKSSVNIHEPIDLFLKSNVWDKIDSSIEELIDSITLEDLINNTFDKNNLMFYI